jgi:hypothetical protein
LLGWVVVAPLVAGCGPGIGPAMEGSATGTGSATSEAHTTEVDSGSGDVPPQTTSSGTSTTSADIDSTGSSGSTGEVTECPPRELPELGVWFRVSIDGRLVYPEPESAECVLDDVVVVPATSTELQLSCTFADGTAGVMTLRFELDLALEVAGLSPGMPLFWTRATEVCCNDWEQHSRALRDAGGALMLGIFQGWDPATSEGAAAVLDPIALELVRGLCPPPCKPLGCVARAAVDVAVAGSAAVRIYDGATDVVGADPAFHTLVVVAEEGSQGLDAPDGRVDVLSLRVSP